MMAPDRWRFAISALVLALGVFSIAETEALSLEELHSSHSNDDSDSLQRALESVENRRLLVERVLHSNSRHQWKRYAKRTGSRRYGAEDPDLAISDKRSYPTSRLFRHPLESELLERDYPEQDVQGAFPERAAPFKSADESVIGGVDKENLLQDVRKKEEGSKDRRSEDGDEADAEEVKNDISKKEDESKEPGYEDHQSTSAPADDVTRKAEEEDSDRTPKTKRSSALRLKKRRNSEDASRLLKLQALSYRNLRKRSKGLDSVSDPRKGFVYGDSRKKKKRTMGGRELILLNGMGDGRYLTPAKRSSKRQFSLPEEKKRQDFNKHLQVWKRGERSFSRGDENIMGELSEILSDGKGGQEVKKREVEVGDEEEKKKSELDDKETNNHSESGVQGEPEAEPKPEKRVSDETANGLTVDQKGPGRAINDKEAFYNWLQNEYFKTMARSMVSAKRKRSQWVPMVSVDANRLSSPTPRSLKTEEVKETVKARIESSDDDSPSGKKNKNRRLKDITEKMKMIEKAMVEDALSLIASGATHGSKEAEKDMSKIVNKLGAAYDVKQMRGALNDLEETFARMAESKDDSDERSSDEEEEKDEEEEVKRKKADSSLADFESGEDYNSIRSSPSMFPSEVSLDNGFGPPFPSAFSDRDVENEIDGDLALMNEKENWGTCPALQLLTSDCSALENFIPRGRAGELLLRLCNWHEVCYTCGEAFGLAAHYCDGGFVQETETICVNDIPCKTTARMMLLPLRERRVFYKRSVPDACFMDPCVEAFLQRN